MIAETKFYITWNVFSLNAIGRFIYGTATHHLFYATIFFLDVNYGLESYIGVF